MIPDLTIGNLMIDCTDAIRAREFYADLLGWETTTLFDCLAVKTDNGMFFTTKPRGVYYRKIISRSIRNY